MKAVRLLLNVWLTGCVAWSLLTLWRLETTADAGLAWLVALVIAAWLTARWPVPFLACAAALLLAAAAVVRFALPPELLPLLGWFDALRLDFQTTLSAWRGGMPDVPEPYAARALLALTAYGFSLLVWLSVHHPRRALTTATVGALVLSVEWLVHHDAALTAAAYFLPGALTLMAAARASELTGAVAVTGPVATAPLSPAAGGADRPQRLTWLHLRVVALGVLAALMLTGLGLILPAHYETIDLGIWRDRLQQRLPLLADLRGTTLRRIALAFDLQQLGFGGSEDELGGPVRTSSALALNVTVRGSDLPDTLYLRGRAPSYYTGRGWVPGSEQPAATGLTAPRGQFSAEASQTSLFAEIQPQGLRTRTLFTILEPMRLQTSGDVEWLHDFTATRTPALNAGDTYQLTVRQPLYSAEEIYRLTDAAAAAAVPDEYLSIPVTLPERVARLAADIAAGHDHPYDRIIAIESYLREYAYDLEAERPPAGADFVDHFLFEQRAGYCVYHATAMTVMLRTLGIPARYVTGFRVDIAGEPGTYEVRNDMAHAWVEAYLPGYGWMTFEPTPAFAVPDRDYSAAAPAVTPGPRPDGPEPVVPTPPADDLTDLLLPETGEPGGGAVAAPRRALSLWSLSLVSAAVAAAAWAATVIASDRGPRPRTAGAVLAAFSLADKLFARSGVPRRPGYTATEHINAAARRWPSLRQPLQALLQAYLPARYGGRHATPVQAELGGDPGAVAARAWQQIRHGVRRYQGSLRYYGRLLRQRLPALPVRRKRGGAPSAK